MNAITPMDRITLIERYMDAIRDELRELRQVYYELDYWRWVATALTRDLATAPEVPAHISLVEWEQWIREYDQWRKDVLTQKWRERNEQPGAA